MLDINRLLQPVSEEQPCGEDLSFSPELDAISRARQFDDPSLDQGEWTTDLKEADWAYVFERCAELIALRSKDLRLAVWLAEAGAKMGSFRGLGDGYSLVAGLFDKFWDGLFPVLDEGDHEQRVGNLSWLLVRSTQLVREMPVTEGRHSAYSLVDFEAARLHMTETGRPGGDERRQAGPTLAEFESARQKSSPDFYKSLLADAQYCAEALRLLESTLDARLGLEGPAFSSARDALEGVMRFITPMVDGTNSGESEERGVNGEAIRALDIMNGAVVAPSGSAAIQTRAQALSQLRMVAEFFRRTEPHSPVAYLADKAAAWGNLPLHDWLRQVVKDQGSLTHIEELLGMQAGAHKE